jgi:hypothetical protein
VEHRDAFREERLLVGSQGDAVEDLSRLCQWPGWKKQHVD